MDGDEEEAAVRAEDLLSAVAMVHLVRVRVRVGLGLGLGLGSRSGSGSGSGLELGLGGLGCHGARQSR